MLSRFIAHRIRHAQGNSFASVIHKIAVASIAVGLAAAIVSFLIMQGFQAAVKDKIYSFSNHLLITRFTMSNAVEEQPFDYRIELYKNPEQFPFITHVQEYAHKAGLVKTDEEVLGIVFKGVGRSFNTEGFKSNLLEGRFINFSDSAYANEVVISKVIADKINVTVGDQLTIHFFQNPPRFRRLEVVGIYETNLSDYFDSKVIMGDIGLVQRLNGWAPHEAGGLEVKVNLNYFTTIALWQQDFNAYSDYAHEAIFSNPEIEYPQLVYLKALYDYQFNFDRAALESASRQIGNSMDYDLYLETVRDKYIQVFEWLDLIKRQVKILLVIILVVVCVNMISVILILVMERTPMVGMLKAMGAKNQLVRNIFLHSGINLILRGLIWGNAIGLSLCFLQYKFKFIALNPRDYYMEYVPVQWGWDTVLILNAIVFGTVLTVLLLPTLYISRINPIQAIRFD
ncbi:MAG TPA: ABC transporter permease [Cyclobacteriaceae bacterium]|nr:ABC transporter permease [Cytophagales bacterium]HRE65853.1 ABC transporter permease [Cyclobacteriaceae bacterium]HRF33697.1 ABC transporter permease [Cyclobacteriaceae bacterium]